MKVGFVGLQYSGKTMLFEAITGAHGTAMEHSGQTRMATVAVPDERLLKISATIQPKKTTHALIDFVDVAGVSTEMEREQAVNILSGLREVDGLVHVVRYFENPSAPPHPHGSLDPRRDLAEIMAELIIADLDIVEKRVEKLEKQVTKSIPAQEREMAQKELALMRRLQEALNSERAIGEVEKTHEEETMLRAYQFLSEKPILHVLNVDEAALKNPETIEKARALHPEAIIICAQAEKEIAELDEADRAAFLEDLGIKEPASHSIIRGCYNALGLRSFFTAGEPDVRAWTIHAGDNALTAAGKIHSDIARGFIRAEVTSYADFEQYGTVKDAKNAGRMRLEGKEYIVQDGDIITVRFKV